MVDCKNWSDVTPNDETSDECTLINVEVDLSQFSRVQILRRFSFAADQIIAKTSGNANCQLAPVLIAENVNGSCLEKIPSCYKTFHVKCVVIDRRLFIVGLATGVLHGVGVPEIIGQVWRWNETLNYFEEMTGSNLNQGNSSSSPDLVLTAKKLLSAGRDQHIFIVELEVGNRSIPEMREHFKRYFDDYPTLLSVLGIKSFSDSVLCPCLRIVAVQWSRTAQGIVVQQVWDFGVEPISGQAKRYFSAPGGLTMLPDVPVAQWEENRYPPVCEAIMNGPELNGDGFVEDVAGMATLYQGNPRAANATLWMCSQLDSVHLFQPDRRPHLRILGVDLMTRLINVPQGNPPLQDLVLDLGIILFVLNETAGTA